MNESRVGTVFALFGAVQINKIGTTIGTLAEMSRIRTNFCGKLQTRREQKSPFFITAVFGEKSFGQKISWANFGERNEKWRHPARKV